MNALVIFDCDGVLVETEALTIRHEVNALQALGYSLTLEQYMEISLGRQSHLIEAMLKEHYQITLPAGFWKDLEVHHKGLFEKELVAVEGVDQVVSSLSIPKCIASGSGLERLHHTLKITKLFPHFEGYIYSVESVARGKPAPDIFLYAAKNMNVSPKECIVIEDSLAGIQGALAAGMKVLAFGGGKHLTNGMRQKLQVSGAHGYFDHMSDCNEAINRAIRADG